MQIIPVLLVLISGIVSCSAPIRKEASPSEEFQRARKYYDDRQYDSAIDILDDLRIVTTGTTLGGEIQYLLAETNYRLKKFPEAESAYSSYLSGYPDGPHASEAIFKRAMANIRVIQRKGIGLLTIKTVLPHDRDIMPVKNARLLFEEYVGKYPDGENAPEARQWIDLLLEKEGLHELGIAKYYLKRKRPDAALARASSILTGRYPEEVKREAEIIVEDALSLKEMGEPYRGENGS